MYFCALNLPRFDVSSTRMGLALGLTYSGSSLGGVMYPVMLYRLLGPLGFTWSVCVLWHSGASLFP